MKRNVFVWTLTILSLAFVVGRLSPVSALCNGVAGIELPGGCVQYPNQIGTPTIDFGKNPSLGTIFAKLLPYIYVFAGLAMLVFLILGGFQLMTSGGEPKAVQAGQSKITNAFIGFGIIFASYWIVQILQVVFHISIVSPVQN